jgi:hypothetical protein
VELTIHNMAAIYFVDQFTLDVKTAGLYVGCFGLLALFARALGGFVSDKLAHSKGLDGRTTWLFALILAEGIGLTLFAKADTVHMAFITMIIFGLFTHMACGALQPDTVHHNKPRAACRDYWRWWQCRCDVLASDEGQRHYRRPVYPIVRSRSAPYARLLFASTPRTRRRNAKLRRGAAAQR